jgi:hypothetical protein
MCWLVSLECRGTCLVCQAGFELCCQCHCLARRDTRPAAVPHESSKSVHMWGWQVSHVFRLFGG